jgi:hypothetical protein
MKLRTIVASGLIAIGGTVSLAAFAIDTPESALPCISADGTQLTPQHAQLHAQVFSAMNQWTLLMGSMHSSNSHMMGYATGRPSPASQGTQ